MSVYGPYKVKSYSIINTLHPNTFIQGHTHYLKDHRVHVYKTMQNDKEFEKKYPYWVVMEDEKGKVGRFVSEHEFNLLLPYMDKIETYKEKCDKKKDPHKGMIQGYDGEWRWL